jgi:hypothetical protein
MNSTTFISIISRFLRGEKVQENGAAHIWLYEGILIIS